MEKRLRAAEQKNLDDEQSWRRTDERLQTAWDQLQSAEQQSQIAAQQLRELQQQLAEADVRIKIFGPQIKSCEQHLERNLTTR